MKFSGLARLVCSNFWVGSTPAQSPQVGPGLHPVLFPEVEQVRGPWCYQDVSYHFRKLLLSQTTVAEQIFYFVDWGLLLRVRTPRGIFFENVAILFKTYPSQNLILRDAYCLFYDLRPPLDFPGVRVVSVILRFGKCWLTFEWLGQLKWNFQGLLCWCPVTFGWVVQLPSPYRVSPGLHPGLWPWNVITLDFFMLPGHVIQVKQKCAHGFLIWGPDAELQVLKGGGRGLKKSEDFKILY